MLSEQETEAMHAMVNDFDRLIASKLPGYAVATYHLQRLATTTGDEWESVVRILLANHRSPTQETRVRQNSGAPDCEKCGGAGWLRGKELDDADHDTATDTMTKYPCDGEQCRALNRLPALGDKNGL